MDNIKYHVQVKNEIFYIGDNKAALTLITVEEKEEDLDDDISLFY